MVFLWLFNLQNNLVIWEFVARFTGKQASERWKYLLTVFWWGGFWAEIHTHSCLNIKPLLFPHGLSCFCECLPCITYGNEKLNIYETSFWVCTLAKLSSSATYYYLCHWWLEYISGRKMSNFSCLLCYDVKKNYGKTMYIYIFFNFNPRQRC